ncbi:hypothetical protein BCL93_104259 [Onishia taeanensis]|uniref:Uncharacterized protein n=1 Tax=Onishia taeanensis TaxID=284577 RepID=A0A328XSW1_9GAMM|nr:hypothetical protein [Halomonas taeanensis]RAR62281.1 hypothetical protein BCL93_104259 [Halomonas taeanensis]
MSRKHQVHDTSGDANDDVNYDGDVDAFMDQGKRMKNRATTGLVALYQ